MELSPRHFGFLRSRWCCGVIVHLLLEIHHIQVSAETVRRWLHREQLVWRRPRPVVGPTDPQREAKLQVLRQLLATLPPNEIAVFQDEVGLRQRFVNFRAIWASRSNGVKSNDPSLLGTFSDATG